MTAVLPLPASGGLPSVEATRDWLAAAGAILGALSSPQVARPPARPLRHPASVGVGAPGVRDAAGKVDRERLLSGLFEQEAPALVRLARLFTDDRNAAEDLVQEAFVRLHHAAHRIEDLAKAAAYLRSIVLNLARDHNRRGLMSLRHQEALTPESSPEAPEDRIVVDERKARVLDALRALSPQQRNCLVLRFYLELSEQETAETLGISANSVKTHSRRGLERLRMRLGGEV